MVCGGEADLKRFDLIRSVMPVVLLGLLDIIQAGNTILGKRDHFQPGFGNGVLAQFAGSVSTVFHLIEGFLHLNQSFAILLSKVE